MNTLFTIYQRVPENIKDKLCCIPTSIPLEIIYGKEYRNWKKFLYESESWSLDKVNDYEVKKLRETLDCAYKNTIYYKKLFDECGFDVSAFRYKEQLQKIPYLTKKIIQNNLENLVNKNLPVSQLKYITTGGSTGIPMGIYRNHTDKIKENAFVDYLWENVGYRHISKVAVLRGGYLGEKGVVCKNGNRLYLSSYHMTEEDMKIQYEALQKYKPKFFHVYPSAICILCDYIKRNHLKPITSLKAVLTASENLYLSQRELIEETLQCRVYDFYGHTEHGCIAGGCRESDRYHILWQYGYSELINENNKEAESENELAEIVTTTYDNFAMPLIRYRTMDMVSNSEKTCSCNKNYKIINGIEGRLQELLITPTGRKISMTAINMHNDIFDHVKQFQFHQNQVNYCTLNIVRDENYTDRDEEKILLEIGKKIGADLELRLQYVESIPRTKSGKFRFLIQELEV